MSDELPMLPSLKISGGKVYVGNPRQLVDLLANTVATPILDISRTKNGMTLYKPKLRCKTLFEGNLEIYFLLDYPNQPLVKDAASDDVIFQMPKDESSLRRGSIDMDRARLYAQHLDEALNFWAVLMEEEVKRVYPDKTPVQMDRFAREAVLAMKPDVYGKEPFVLSSFLKDKCDAKKAIPCFKVAYGWVGSKEEPRATEHGWGFKFALSPFPQYIASARVRKPAVSAAEKQEALAKKRKVEETAAVVEESKESA